MKRLLALLLVVFMVFSLAACGGKKDKTTTETKDQTSVETTSASENESETESTSETQSQSTSETDTKSEAEELSFITFNLRYDTSSHALMSEKIRGAHLMEIIDKYQPSSIGFQEATNTWMNYLRTNMAERNYAYVGVGRDDGQDTVGKTGSGNEFSAIFYRSDLFDKLEGGTFWLSNTPDTISGRAWGAGNTRICTYVVLKNKQTGTIYAHFNTHLDHVSTQARENGALLIISRINMTLAKYGNIGIVATGDFNDVFNSKPYNIMTSFLQDSRYIAKSKPVDGSSWSGFQNPVEWAQGHPSDRDKPAVNTDEYPIDYIFLSGGFFDVPLYSILNETFNTVHENQTWYNQPVSDHYGVYCKVQTKKEPTEQVLNESKLIDKKATVYKYGELPSGILNGLTNFAPNATATSSIACQTGFEISNILLEGSEKFAKTQLIFNKGIFFEVTIALESSANVKVITFTTTKTDKKAPISMHMLISSDGINWSKVGATFKEIDKDNTYAFVLESETKATHVKLVMVDAPMSAELANVSIYGTEAEETVVPTSKIELISGPKSGKSEGYEKLFDNDTKTKYYHNIANDGAIVPIILKVKTPVTLTGYTLYTANDHTSYNGRLAKSWVLYGSNTGEDGTWEEISNISDSGLEEINLKPYTYKIDNPKEYQFYKFEITEAGSQNRVQFAEMILITGQID